MVMKTVGFITGGAVGALALIGWSALTKTTDVDRFERMLVACVSYVTTGALPFIDEGRNVGVYDAPLFEGDFVADTHRIIENDRFEAAWEAVLDEEQPIRLCRVTARFDGPQQLDFDLENLDIIPLVTELLAPIAQMQPETDQMGGGLATLAWYEVGKERSEGLRTVLTAKPGYVSSFLVVNDLD